VPPYATDAPSVIAAATKTLLTVFIPTSSSR
jgi:hypothetical protein